MKSANKVIFNTGVLYGQLIISMAIGLFTTRIVLDALGETNYGIYMLVAGVVGILGILNSNMANTSMRYMAHSLGTNDKKTIQKTFNTTLILHFVIGAIVVILMQIGGWFMFEYLLNIPDDKVFDAKIVFQFMVITTFITVISVPYDAVMNSHENMLALSLVDILGSVLKLGVAIYLTFSEANLLILYGFLILVIQLILRVIKQWYSRMKYEECKIRLRGYVDKTLMKSILSFTSWNLFGSLGALAVTQVRGVILNMFFGVSLNAAQGIAQSASTPVNMVSESMTRAINPQLTKSEGGGDRQRMLRITEISTKYSVFLFALFAIPVLLEAKFLLNLWLKEVPEYAVVFFQLSLITMFIEKFTFQITHAIRAVGIIKKFQVTETMFRILNIPLAYLAFKAGYEPYSIYIIGGLISLIVFFNRLYFGKIITELKILAYMKYAMLPVLVPLVISLTVAIVLHMNMHEGLFRLILVSILFLVLLSIGFWQLGITINERKTFISIMYKVLDRVKYKYKK